MNKNYLVWGGVGVALLFSFLAWTKPGQVVVKEVAQNLGSVASPDINSPYFSYGGVRSWGSQSSLIQASTTICSLQSPAATSTLIFASMHMNVATTGGASTITFSRANQGNSASSTVIKSDTTALGSGAEANMVASSTLFGPNQWLNVTQAGGGTFIGGTFSETGVCQAQWVQMVY